ncbi:MAG: glycoside hydrolase family 3 C-terminal domain-containing protein [Treponema sp.]|jgi:beta-glucosidase|nr:glycoside hydrolase family 3 C-terminal domain-containing protein [Treponema sp.]
MSSAQRKMSNKKFLTVWITVLSIVFILAAGLTIVCGVFSPTITMALGGQKYRIVGEAANVDTAYFKSKYNNPEDASAAAKALTVTIEEEGIVLLKNDEKSVLPLQEGAKVSVFGRTSIDLIYGGSGSGNVDTSTAATLESSLSAAGYQVNPALISFYKTMSEVKGPQIGTGSIFFGGQPIYFQPYKHAAIQMDLPEVSTYHIGEVALNEYTPEVQQSYADYHDAAIVIFGRGGGEGGDLSQDIYADMAHYNAEAQSFLTRLGIKPGQHQLELSQNELDLLEHVRSQGFDKVIVIINSSEAMELGFLDEDWINAALWIGSPGEGMNALGRVIKGEVNPSGRLVDTYAYDLTSAPSYNNFGNYVYDDAPGNYFVEYEEGIYVGYRYYETRYHDNETAYRQTVQFPFGYGLSYTSFEWELARSSPAAGSALSADGAITIDVRVRNTGTRAGKDVVELYATAPYTPGGIEKAHVVLAGFEKTGLIAPGSEQTVSITIPVYALASYDYNDANKNSFRGYELENGTYQLKLMKNAHDLSAVSPIEYKVESTLRYEEDPLTGYNVVNRFDQASNRIKVYLSRNDWEGTWPQAPTAADRTAGAAVIAAVSPFVAADHNNPNDETPVFNAKNNISLINLKDMPYDDPLWEPLLDQLDINEFVELFRTGSYNTAVMQSVSKPVTQDLDGPAGLSAYIGNTSATAYPSECIIAATWSKSAARQMGEAVGDEGLQAGVHGWYAPAMNIHRSPFAGRNFEYYSEDSILSGEIAAQVVAGAVSKGMVTYIKHFALNDQETNRVRDNGLMTWANEQAIREIYLKPFEYAVKNGGSTGVMSSFNRIGTEWSGGSRELLTEILRNEWGFQGSVITDFNLYPYMNQDKALRNGGDFMLTMYMPPVYDKTPADISSPTAKKAIRNAAHNILYATVNSNAMNGVAPGVVFRAITPTWVILLIIADAVIFCGIMIALILIRKRVRSHKG